MSVRSTRHLISLVLAATVTWGVGLAMPGPAAAWSAGTFSSSSERELVALTNRSRASAGLRSLRVDSTLTSVARWRSKDMIDRDYFSHDIPGYGTVFKKLDAKGYCYKVAGENIGWNTYPDDVATAEIHQMFMDSSGHRANILGRAWDVIGVGAYKGPDGKKMWTVLFADRCGSTTASAPRATPRPTPRPTPKPKPKPVVAATPTPTPPPTPSPAPTLTAPPAVAGLTVSDREAGSARDGSDGSATQPTGDAPSTLRVVESSTSRGLVDTIVGSVTGLFFGA
jgi:uncharacterized protein YkwD